MTDKSDPSAKDSLFVEPHGIRGTTMLPSGRADVVSGSTDVVSGRTGTVSGRTGTPPTSSASEPAAESGAAATSPLGTSVKRPADEPAEDEPNAKSARRTIPGKVNYLGDELEEYDSAEAFCFELHEGLPMVASSLPQCRRAQILSAKGLRLVLADLEALPEQGIEIARLVQQMKKCLNAKLRKKFVVVLVGDTGAGKSTFLNKLLGCLHQLAVQGATGKAQTQVVTEYHFDDRYTKENANKLSQRSTIVFKSKDKTDQEITTQLETYLKFHNTAFRNNRGAQKKKEDVCEAETAEEFLLTIFANRSGGHFRTAEKLRAYAKKMKVKACDKLSKALQDHYESMLQRRLATTGNPITREVYIDEANAADHNRASAPYTQRPVTGQSGFWPLVDRAQTFVPCPLLAEGLVVADCPGLSDSNAIRRDASEKYIKDANMVFLFANIERIVDHPMMRKYLRSFLACKPIEDVVVVPTQIDAIGGPEEADSTDGGLEHHRHVITASREEYSLADDAFRAAPKGKKNSAARTVLKQARDEALATLQRARIMMRNEAVDQSLQKLLPVEYAGKKLAVMPVSSNQHQIYVDGLAQDEPTPILRMNSYGHGEDGIAAIRSLIFMRAQDGLMQRLLDYVFNDIEVPLGRMKLVLEKNPDERRDSIFDAVHEAITNAEGCVLGYSDMLKSAADKKVLSSMTKTNKHWIRRFDELIAQWQVVAQAHQTFKAIARRDGRHYIKKRDETTDWNGDVVEVISPSIQLMVRDFKEHCDKRQTQLLESFNRTLDNLRDTIKTDPNIGGIDMTTIFQLLETHKKHFEQRVPLAFAELADNIEKIGNGILPDANEIRAGGSVGWNQGRDFYKSMKSIYLGLLSDAKFRPGTKRVTARRWAYLRERLRNTKAKNPMSSLKADFKYRFTNVLNDFTNCIMDIMQDPFREISADLEARFGRYEDFQDQATRDTIKAALEKVLPQARAMFDEAQECLNYAVEWEKEHTQVKRPPAKVVRVKAEDFLDDMVSDLEDEDEDDDEDGGETEDSDSDLESEAD